MNELQRRRQTAAKKYTAAVERNLAGLEFVSTGPCPGCSECAEAFGYEDDDDEKPGARTAVEKYDADYEAGKVEAQATFSRQDCGICGSSLGGDREVWHGRSIMHPQWGILHYDDACTDCVMYLANGDTPERWEG